ncbi:MAG: GNAT family N-acetyltransferase [Chloroflexota bacterium]|nr:GNAT family N-acetyltransferase [Chloroflexota bacterium]
MTGEDVARGRLVDVSRPVDEGRSTEDPGLAYGSRAWQTPADSRQMQALVSRCWREDWPDVHLHAGDVDWWTMHALGRTPGLGERIRLWFAGEPDATELVAFGWYGPPSDADLTILPAHRTTALIGPIVAWIDGQVARFGLAPDPDAAEPTAAEPPAPLRIWTAESDAPQMAALIKLGFGPGPEPGFNHFVGHLGRLDLGSAELPGGYALTTVATDADIAARVTAGRAAFQGSTMTVEKYRFCRATPLYRPALDTLITAPDGSVAAFALAWLDPLTLAVELEPVGTHPDHQRRGLGSAVCRAALRVARAMGGQQVLVAADGGNPAAHGLYASLGLGLAARIIAFRRSPAADRGSSAAL